MQVICPKCNKLGTMIVRERGRKKYIYVQHKIWDPTSHKQKTLEHYIGSAEEWYLSKSLFNKEVVKKPTVKVEVKAVVSGDEKIIEIPNPYNCIRMDLFEDVNEKLKDIKFKRQIILDYITFLTVVKKEIESRINVFKEKYGVEDKDIEERMRDFFMPMIFYVKLRNRKRRRRK